MIAPASPLERIALVVETLRPSLDKVKTKSKLGKEENSSALETLMLIKSTSMAVAMFTATRRSITKSGSGITIMTTIITTAAGKATLPIPRPMWNLLYRET
jgi:hypothetical protein